MASFSCKTVITSVEKLVTCKRLGAALVIGRPAKAYTGLLIEVPMPILSHFTTLSADVTTA
jgi:hypothetical protein